MANCGTPLEFPQGVWKIFVRSEIPTRVPTADLVQKCITLPFLGSSGTSHLLLFGHVLAHSMGSSVLRSQADLFAYSFSRLGVTVLQAEWPGRPPSVPVQVPFSIELNSTLASFRGAATSFQGKFEAVSDLRTERFK